MHILYTQITDSDTDSIVIGNRSCFAMCAVENIFLKMKLKNNPKNYVRM